MSALPSNIRFVRSPVGQAVTLRMPAAEGTGVAGRPSPPGVLFRQQIFQRPLPPDAPKPPPVIRAILVPKPGAAGQQQLVFASQVSFKPTDPQVASLHFAFRFSFFARRVSLNRGSAGRRPRSSFPLNRCR